MFPIIWCSNADTTVKKIPLTGEDPSSTVNPPPDVPLRTPTVNPDGALLVEEPIKNENKSTYATVLNDARNMRVLSSQQIACVRTLPKDKVLEFIDVYNQIMENVNEILLGINVSEQNTT